MVTTQDPLLGRIIRAPGRIVVAPVSLAAEFPHGGTVLGRVRGCSLQFAGTPYLVESEGLGDVNEILEPDHRYVWSMIVRGWNDDATRLLMPDLFEEGASSQHAVVIHPGTRYPGTSELGHGVKLLFVPDDPMRVPCMIAYRAVADWAEGFSFQRGEELAMAISFQCMDDASTRIIAIGRREDLTL